MAGLRDRQTRHCLTGTRAPPEGIEPPTGRLTAGCPATGRRWNAVPGEGFEPPQHGFRDRRPASWTIPEQTPSCFLKDSFSCSCSGHSGGTTRTCIRGVKVPRPADWTTPEQNPNGQSGMRESNSLHQLGRLRPRPVDQSRRVRSPQKESNLPTRLTRPLRCHLRHEGAMPPGGLEPPTNGLRIRCATVAPRGQDAGPGNRTPPAIEAADLQSTPRP